MKAGIPQLNIKEIINQDYVSADIKAGAFLPANTGYRNLTYVIQNSEQLISIFGLPTNYNYKYWWNIYNYLQYITTDGIYVVNSTSVNDKNYSMKLTGTDTKINNISHTNLYNKNLATNLIFNETISDCSLEVYNRYVENENKLAITVCGNEEDWFNSITNETIETIRDLNVYDYNEITTIYNNKYLLEFNEPNILDVYNDKVGTNNYVVLEGNQTQIKVNEKVRLNESNIVNVEKIESNEYRVEDINVGFMFTLTGDASAIVVDDVVLGSTSTTTGKVHSITGNSVVIYDLTGDFDNNELIKINDVITTITIAEITYTAQPIFILDGNYQFLNDDEIINILGDNTNYLISSHTYISAIDKTNIITNKTVSSFDEINDCNKLVLQSNTTSLILDTDIEPTNIKYLASNWNSIDYDLGGTTGSVLENANTTDKKIISYNNLTFKWEFITLENGKYYVKNNDKVYVYDGSFTEDVIRGIEINNNYAIKNVYDSEVIKNNVVATYKDIFYQKPDFTNGEFGIIVFRKNKDQYYAIEEKYVIKYDRKSEITIYNNSSLIYLKLNSITDKVNTKNYSIEDLTIQVDTSQDYSNINHYTYNELVNTCNIYKDVDYYTVDYLFAFKSNEIEENYNFDIMTNLVKGRKNTIAINSIWEESQYFGKTENELTELLINNFGCQDFKYNSKIKVFSEYMAMFGGMKLQYDIYNDAYIWVPLIGDIAGNLVIDENGTGVGYDKPFKNTERLLFNITGTQNKKDLNRNGINLITYNNLSEAIIFDSITSTKDLNSMFRELQKRKTLNMIKNDLRRFFFSQFLKIVPNDINLILQNYLRKLYKNDKINSGYSKEVIKIGNTINVNIKFSFTDILRTVNLSITIDESGVDIKEI